MIRRPPRSTQWSGRRQRQMCIRDSIYINVDFALGIKPDADYYLYIPGTPYEYAPNEDSRLDQLWSVDGGEGKSQGFVIWNKYEDEVFNERY